jgi:hypothetical protein
MQSPAEAPGIGDQRSDADAGLPQQRRRDARSGVPTHWNASGATSVTERSNFDQIEFSEHMRIALLQDARRHGIEV